MERVTLQATSRPEIGKAAAKRLRRQGSIPAIVYGKNSSNVQVSVNAREMVKLLHKSGDKIIIDLVVSESDAGEQTVIIKTLQFDPVKDSILHVDFQKITLTDTVKVTVPLVFRGEDTCLAIKSGGVLEHILREVEIESLPLQLPKQLIVNVAELEVEGHICVKDLKTEDGVQILSDAEQVIVVAHMPAEEKPEEESEDVVAAATEPEVLKQKKPEDGK